MQKEMLTFATTWMTSEAIVLNQMSQQNTWFHLNSEQTEPQIQIHRNWEKWNQAAGGEGHEGAGRWRPKGTKFHTDSLSRTRRVDAQHEDHSSEFLFCCCGNTPKTTYGRKSWLWAYSYRGRIHNGREAQEQGATPGCGKIITSQPPTWSRESEPEVRLTYEISKPTTSNRLTSPREALPPKPPQTAPLTVWRSAFIYTRLWGTSAQIYEPVGDISRSTGHLPTE